MVMHWEIIQTSESKRFFAVWEKYSAYSPINAFLSPAYITEEKWNYIILQDASSKYLTYCLKCKVEKLTRNSLRGKVLRAISP